jgi:phospholipid/cholesterol/gamma-HCH transport system substrate-binding protein
VYFLGTLVGSVSDVLVDSAGRMEAQTRVRRDFFLFVRADSSAVVKKKFGVAGDAFFELTRGVGKSLPEQNASILCKEQFQSGFESAIEEIRAETVQVLRKANTGLETWSRLGTDLYATREKMDQLAARWDGIVAGIARGDGTIGKLLMETDVADEALDLVSTANITLGELRTMMTNLNTVVQNIHQGTAQFPEIATNVANEAKELPGLVRQTQTSMNELERLILGMQQHWLIRKHVAKANRTNSTVEDSRTTSKRPSAPRAGK